ncbi:MAG TPA: hypothetical protein VKU79_00745 [Thermoplasmataceae archaeon]|nr:hypothetical protein [Thermoplasmataceae archaeon]
MSEKLTLVLPDELSKAISTETSGLHLSRQQFILEAVREKLARLRGAFLDDK